MSSRSAHSEGSARSAGPFRALLLLGVLLHGGPGAAAPPVAPSDDAYLETLLERAREENLARDPYWRTLLHSKRGLLGRRSLVDDPQFFLAPNGKHDPAAELEATLRAFFRPEAADERHPVCRFLARYSWLSDRLGIDESRLPVPVCEPFETMMEEIRPESVTLIFPTSHMNSPASMYGHTLLTIDGATDSKLLSYAVNYAAFTDETFGPFYIFKGLLGLYPGYFSILPYYAKLQEYSDVNDRDIWEYPLRLEKAEIRRLMMHLYELEDVSSDYYFFGENCSYDLLFLLDVARPGLDLTDRCGWWVIPLDTVRLIRRSGLAVEAVYRPSKSTKIRDLASRLPRNGRKEALAIAAGERDPERALDGPTPPEEKATVCDLAGEILQYRLAKGDIPKPQYVDRFLKVLETRSRLGTGVGGEGDAEPPVRTAPVRPDDGHHSNRVSLGTGLREDHPFQELRLRPAYHTLLDNGRGYKRGSQIVFLDTAVRYRTHEEKLEIERIDLIDIVSIAPRDLIFKPTSWKFRTGFFRRTLDGQRRHLVYGFDPGFGWAWESGLAGIAYGMLETDLHVGAVLDGGYSLGAGASAGILRDLTRRWKVHLFGRGIHYGLGDPDEQFEVGLGQNLELGADTSVSLELTGRHERNETKREGTLRCNRFF